MKRRVLVLTPLLLACGPFFYQAPPPLENYPQRIPGKSWSDIFNEAKPAAAEAAKSDDIARFWPEFFPTVATLPRDERLAKIDSLLVRNREGDFNRRSADFIHELRELAADDAILAEAEPYLNWRVGLLSLPASRLSDPPAKQWDWSDEDYRLAIMRHEAQQKAITEWLAKGQEQTPPSLQPNQQVQQAAILYRAGKFEEASQAFQQVIDTTPDHPRAEVAFFMLGRCALEESRREKRLNAGKKEENPKIDELQQLARDSFAAYLERYPSGRFTSDAKGWLGAVAADQQDYVGALGLQLERLDLQPSRETMRSVLRECDWLFAGLFERPDAADDTEYLTYSMPWDAMSRHPEIARLFVYQALDPAARENLPQLDRNVASDRGTLDFLHRRIVRPQAFARRALSLLGEAVVKATAGETPDPFTLLVLGWSSLRDDQAEQALVLFDRALATSRSDELLQGRALALSQLGRHADAVATYGDLARDFPNSPLAKPTAFERGIARFRAGQAGDALLEMLALTPASGNGTDAEPSLQPEHEPIQWVDTIAQFGPVDQLAAPLAKLPADDPRATLLRAIVRSRALAAGRFDLAKLHLDPNPDNEPPPEYVVGQLWPPRMRMEEAQWMRDIEPLEAAYQRSKNGGQEDATLHLEIGRRWKALRGDITLPLHRLFDYSQSETEKLDLLRRRNAAFLGLSPETIAAELDSRDELHHALQHFLAAAEHSEDPAIAAPALEEANEALFRLAEFSLYRSSRAVETDASGLSSRLVGRLHAEFPDRPESIRSVAWTFTPPALLGRWMPGDYTPGNSADAIVAAVMDPRDNRWQPWQDKPEDPAVAKARSIANSLITLTVDDGRDMAAIRKNLTAWKSEFVPLRHGLAASDLITTVDNLDDLVSAAQSPGITPALFRRYISLRLDRGTPPPAEGEWRDLKPWLEFLDRIRPIPVDDGGTRPNRDTIESWESYLQAFPNGPKTEAASLRLLRLKVRKVCPIPQVQAFHFPAAPILNGYKRLTRPLFPGGRELESLDQLLVSHEKRFPKGRYQADLDLLHAAIAADIGDYETALSELASILSDANHPELRMDAALQLSDCGLRLLDLEERAAVAGAFRKTPAAMPYLKNLVHGDTCLFRLRPLMAWLESGK